MFTLIQRTERKMKQQINLKLLFLKDYLNAIKANILH